MQLGLGVNLTGAALSPEQLLVPSDDAGLTHWHQSDVGTPGIVLNGSDVSAWTKVSGSSGVDLEQTTAADQPPYVATGFGSKNHAYVDFDGATTEDFLVTDAAEVSHNGTSYLYLFAIELHSTPIVVQYLFYPPGWPNSLLMGVFPTRKPYLQHGGLSYAVPTDAIALNTPSVIALGWDSVSSEIVYRVNGGAIDRLAKAVGVTGGPAVAEVGGDVGEGANRHFDGKMREMAIWYGSAGLVLTDALITRQVDAMRVRAGTS